MTGPNAPGTRVLLLRHAETSAPDVFHGAESDVGLGTRGIAQARKAGGRLAAIGPDAIYASEMRRALESARIIAEACGLSARIWPGIHERRMGSMSGQSRSEGWPIYEETKEHWKAGLLDTTHEGGESFAELRDRATAAFRSLLEAEAGRTVVVVAHGIVNRVLLASMLAGYSPADFDRIPIEFLGIHDLRWDGETLLLADYVPGEATPPLRPRPRLP